MKDRIKNSFLFLLHSIFVMLVSHPARVESVDDPRSGCDDVTKCGHVTSSVAHDQREEGRVLSSEFACVWRVFDM